MKTSIMLFAVTASAISLSGCASMFEGHQAATDSSRTLNMDQIYHEYAAEQLELGRKAMKAGAYTAALEPLRMAAKDRRSAPAAFNAMGVVYTRIGRADVAQRLFTMALFLEPENKAFAANILKLKAEQQVASISERKFAESGDSELPAAPEPVPANGVEKKVQVSIDRPTRVIASTYGTAVSANAGIGQVVRVSEHEVRVGAPHAATPAQNRAVAAMEYPAKVEFRRGKERLQGKPSSRLTYVQRVNF